MMLNMHRWTWSSPNADKSLLPPSCTLRLSQICRYFKCKTGLKEQMWFQFGRILERLQRKATIMNLCTYVTNLFRINLYWSTGLTVRFYISSTVRHNSFLRGYKKIIHYLLLYYIPFCGPGSSVGIATGYGLDGPGIESRWGARFSPPVQTGPGAHPASCTMGTGFFPGGKERPGRDADPSPPSSAVVMKG